MRLLKIFGVSFSLSLRRSFAFRIDLVFQIVMALFDIASSFLTLDVIYTQTTTLGGWTLSEAIVLMGTFQIMGSLLGTFILPNVTWFADQVENGKLDAILLQPVPSIFQASLGSCSPSGLLQTLTGSIILFIGLVLGGSIPTLWHIFLWMLLVIVGIIIMWATRVLLATVVFWAPGFELGIVYHSLWQFGRYPTSIYRQPLRFVLTYFLPVAFIATVPAQALTQGINLWLAGSALIVGSLVLCLVLLTWNAGLRRYTSATS